MKWTQFFVLTFMTFQQACAVQEYFELSLRIKALNADNFYILSDGNDDALIEYSKLYLNDNVKPLDQKKMIKLIKVQDNQANTLVKRENNKPKLGRSTSAPASISGVSGHHNVPHSASSTATPATANKMKSFFKGKTGKIAAGVGLATIAAGAITGAVVYHNHKNRKYQDAQQSVDMSQQQPEMKKRQENESFEPLVRRGKMPKGKGFALLAGGAAIGATGMHLYHKSGNSPAADPNAAAAGPPPPPAK